MISIDIRVHGYFLVKKSRILKGMGKWDFEYFQIARIFPDLIYVFEGRLERSVYSYKGRQAVIMRMKTYFYELLKLKLYKTKLVNS